MAKGKPYNPDVELAKGAKLEAATYDKTQKIAVIVGKVTVGGVAGVVEISGTATGRHDASIDGCLGIWLSIFRYMRPDGTIDHVAGLNIMAETVQGQNPETTAKTFADQLNASTRPYKAVSAVNGESATVTITFVKK